MSGRTQLRRRGRGIGLRGLLVEREAELALLEQRLADARAGTGSVVMLDAPAGNGKSRLLTIAGDMAREAGMQVLGAQGSEIEGDFPFGVAIQLFEPRWLAAGAQARLRLGEGPARWAGALLSGEIAEPTPFAGDGGYAVIHGLFRLACNLAAPAGDEAAGRPLVMLVDDAHWADRRSLRFLAYLAERLAALPILLIVAVRPGEPSADRPALLAMRDAAEDGLLRPGSLSEEGVATIVRSELPGADPSFCKACALVTGGNAFLLTALIEQVRTNGDRPDSTTAQRLAELPPEAVLDAVVARLERMSPAARAVASAVAVLGDSATLPAVAGLAGLSPEVTSHSADQLATMHLFHPGSPLSYVHPLIRSAVRRSMSPLQRGEAHRRAAAVLTEQEAPAEAIAVHLMSASAGSDPHAVGVLRSAARRALATGAADSAVRMLKRALAEQPAPDVYPDVLAELGQAELAAGLPQAVNRLDHAIDLTEDPRRRAQLALARGDALYAQCRFRDAALALLAAREQLGDEAPQLAEELEAAYLAAGSLVPELFDEVRRRSLQLLARLGDHPTPRDRAALAHIAMQSALRGGDRVSIGNLAELAWGDGALLRADAADGTNWPLVTGALLFVDELERDVEICDAALAEAAAEESPAGYAAASYCRAWPLYEQGRVLEATTHAQAALDARSDRWRTYLRSAYGALACCHLQRGELDQAETALSIIDHPEVNNSSQLPFLLDARAQLRLAQLRPREALHDALEAGRRLESEFGAVSPGAISWRSTAALAHLALGDAARACELASEELEHARAAGVGRVVIRDLRVLGLAERGRRGITLLSEAVQAGEGQPTRLEHILALNDLGAALRRANQRAAAREPLRRALDLSHRGGATAIAERARTELAATGARPRRVMLSGVESLTPSERRVAGLAVRGLTTREIAEALFITPKTVEFHLRHIYRKLEISGRGELAGALGESEGDGE